MLDEQDLFPLENQEVRGLFTDPALMFFFVKLKKYRDVAPVKRGLRHVTSLQNNLRFFLGMVLQHFYSFGRG